MKCFTPEIAWHNRDPVFSIDIQPDKISESVYRLASGGADTHLVIWHVEYGCNGIKGSPKIEVVADLTRHQKAVNIVRFSPSSEFLASGDDDSVILIWKRKKKPEFPDFPDLENENKEHWTCIKTLRLHLNDVYDISWSSDSAYLVSGSVDNTAILWDVSTGNTLAMLKEHKGFVQGVAWDPLQKYVATLSSDRTLRVFSTSTKHMICQCNKAVLPRQRSCKNDTHNIAGRIFHDDTLKTYFRRLCFSPDGSLLFVPSGILDLSPGQPNTNSTTDCQDKVNNATPIMYYPSADKYSVAVRCCPVLFQKSKSEEKDEIFNMPYKMVIAVATKSTILLYDTEHVAPFGYVTDVHYTRLTDISWSNDGLLLVVSSTDGFCTFISFENGELGLPWQKNNSIDDSTNIVDDLCQAANVKEGSNI